MKGIREYVGVVFHFNPYTVLDEIKKQAKIRETASGRCLVLNIDTPDFCLDANSQKFRAFLLTEEKE